MTPIPTQRPHSAERSSRTRRLLAASCCATVLATGAAAAWLAVGTAGVAHAYPEPAISPVSWELDFEYRTPQRIVLPDSNGQPQAFWYMIYTVTNNTDEEQLFLPVIELVSRDGTVLPANFNIPGSVHQAIDERTTSLNLATPKEITGLLRVGEDQAKSSVAIWREPTVEMGTFDIFVEGLSGEFATLKDAQGQPLTNSQGQPIIVRKTLQLTYKVRGDEYFPAQDQAVKVKDDWIMR